MNPKLHHRFRPKADWQLLQDSIQEAWGQWHKKNFPESEQRVIGMLLADRLELRYPQADMEVLHKYGLANSPEAAIINVFSPDSQRWDVYISITLSRRVLCPSGRAQFFVGGDRSGSDQLPKEFEPFFNKVREGREQYNAEMRYRPQQSEQEQYPTWNKIADELKVTGPCIREKLK